MAKTKTRIRRTFTSEYKLQAVQLVTEKGFSYAEAARQLSLSDTQIRWTIVLLADRLVEMTSSIPSTRPPCGGR